MSRPSSPLPRPADRVRPRLHHVVLVAGHPGSGKSMLLHDIEAEHRPRGCRFVILDHMQDWLSGVPGRIVLREGTPEDAARVANANAPCTLVIDEAWWAFPWPGWNPERTPALTELLRVGRQPRPVPGHEFERYGPVSLLLSTQRPAEIAPAVRNLADRVYLGQFAGHAARDLEAVAAMAPSDPDIAKRVVALPQFSFLVRRGPGG